MNVFDQLLMLYGGTPRLTGALTRRSTPYQEWRSDMKWAKAREQRAKMKKHNRKEKKRNKHWGRS